MTQQEYLLILFNDTGFTINSRNAWLTARYKRPVKYLSELIPREASDVIARLKEIRDQQKGKHPW
jgi:hypothetical protein